MRRPNVLLVGESLNQYSYLAQRLTSWGGECRFAISHKDVCALVGQQNFELVISQMNLVDGSALRMIPLLEGSPTSLFCFHPIEDSCLWMPVVEKGRICFGAGVLQPIEFGRILRRTLTEGRGMAVAELRVQELPAAPELSPLQREAKPRALAKAG
jgi:hypothetical protein